MTSAEAVTGEESISVASDKPERFCQSDREFCVSLRLECFVCDVAESTTS